MKIVLRIVFLTIKSYEIYIQSVIALLNESLDHPGPALNILIAFNKYLTYDDLLFIELHETLPFRASSEYQGWSPCESRYATKLP